MLLMSSHTLDKAVHQQALRRFCRQILFHLVKALAHNLSQQVVLLRS